MADTTTHVRASDILVVDDDSALCAVITKALTRNGYAVRQAPNGLAALLAITEQPPALLLLDLRMPGLSGSELLAGLQASRHTFPIVLITAVPELAEPYIDDSRVVCLAKPFDVESLLTTVAHYIERPATSETS